MGVAGPDQAEPIGVETLGLCELEAGQERIAHVGPFEIDPDAIDMGVFGKVVKNPAEHALREGDRVELYRPLKIDPKQARLNRAKKKA